jgi:hypothetical protein
MPSTPLQRRGARLVVIAVVLAMLAASASADSEPIGKLPAGPIVTVKVARGELVSMALPRPSRARVWRIARAVDSKVLRQVSEGDLASGPVIVFRAVGRGHAVVRFALTRGDASAKALAARTLEITVLG